MPDGFVQQNAGPAGAEDDFHLAGGGSDRSELEDRLAGGLAGEVLGGLFRLEEVDLDAAAAAGGSARGAVGVFGEDEDVQTRQGLGVAGEGAVGGGDEDAAQFVGVAGAHLRDAGIVGAGGLVGAHDQIELGGEVAVEIDCWSRIQAWGLGLRKALHRLLGRAAGDQGRGARGAQQAVGGEVVGVGVAGALAADDADAAAGADSLAGGLDERFVDADRGRGNRFEVEVGVVASGGEGFAEAALEQPLGDAEFVEEIFLVLRSGRGR